MATTPILSPFGKLRAGLELFIPSRKDDGDESMADFIRRRLGKEVFERPVEPLVSGVYAADMEKLSVMATLPRFREMERDHGSLIRAMQKQLAANRSANLSEQSGARYSMFVTLRNGLSSLCDALAERLPEGTLKLDCEVGKLEKNANGTWTISFRHPRESGDLGDTESFSLGSRFRGNDDYDAIILATETHSAAKILAEPQPELSKKLAVIRHEGTAIATFAFNADQLKQPIRGMGFVVPKIEKSPILAGSFSSFKYEHRAPNDKILIRIFAGGARSPESAEMPEDRLVPILQAELKKIVRIDGEPLFTTVAHWPRTMPQYHVGHRELVHDIETLCAAEPTLAVAGNAFHGVGIPNCIKSGFDAAEKIGSRSTG
jgi:oxygen-dependent protoporphyrinogen oxidase